MYFCCLSISFQSCNSKLSCSNSHFDEELHQFPSHFEYTPIIKILLKRLHHLATTLCNIHVSAAIHSLTLKKMSCIGLVYVKNHMEKTAQLKTMNRSLPRTFITVRFIDIVTVNGAVFCMQILAAWFSTSSI